MRATDKLPVILIIIACIGLGGCGAEFHSIYRKDRADADALLISTDAKQRIIIRGKRVGSGEFVTCVEPPPDALTVLAASASGNVALPSGLSAGLSGSSSEAGTPIGLRTQTITVLRDQSFRICEGYLNGSVSPNAYAQQIRRNQILTTAVLAIEQLTGAVAGSSTAIGAATSLEIDDAAVQKASENLQGQVEKLGTQEGVVNEKNSIVQGKKAQITDLQRTLRSETDLTKRTALENEIQQAGAALRSAESELITEQGKLSGIKRATALAQQQLNAAMQPNLRSSTSLSPQNATFVSKDIPEVAEAVRAIVEMAFNKSYILELCQMYWSGSLQFGGKPSSGNASSSTSSASSSVTVSSGETSLSDPKLTTVCDTVLASWIEMVKKIPPNQAAQGGGLFGTPTPPKVRK